MKTTLDIHDDLMERAKAVSRETGRPLRALVEEGLRRVLEELATPPQYDLPDLSVGRPGDPDPTATSSWQKLRGAIHADRINDDRD